MMNFALVKARSAIGIHARPVSVEVHLSNGLPQFNLVGLPETAVKESKDRVRSAILNSYFEFPTRRITVNLAPADLPKVGSGFDLAIAIGILAASMQIPDLHLSTHEFIGELALDGCIRGVSSIIPIVLSAHREAQQVIISKENAKEAALTQLANVAVAKHLKEVCQYLCQGTPLEKLPPSEIQEESHIAIDWSDVKGQPHAKYALEIAAMGGHSVLMFGPPGSGKTMLARRFHTILPDLEEKAALEVAAIHSLKGKGIRYHLLKRPPFRAPHHTASMIALVGGGSPLKPGEISLAHHGVLFLDELPEFQRNVIETLREPLELGEISIARAAMQIEFPARFQLIAAMNPCPCGEGSDNHRCVCTPERISRYLSKLSSPFLDRIDIHLAIQPLLPDVLIQPIEKAEKLSKKIQSKVKWVQDKQIKRQGVLNALLSVKQCEAVCQLGAKELAFLRQLMSRYAFSARSFHRLLKVARTIADARDVKTVKVPCLQEAMSFKQNIK